MPWTWNFIKGESILASWRNKSGTGDLGAVGGCFLFCASYCGSEGVLRNNWETRRRLSNDREQHWANRRRPSCVGWIEYSSEILPVLPFFLPFFHIFCSRPTQQISSFFLCSKFDPLSSSACVKYATRKALQEMRLERNIFLPIFSSKYLLNLLSSTRDNRDKNM